MLLLVFTMSFANCRAAEYPYVVIEGVEKKVLREAVINELLSGGKWGIISVNDYQVVFRRSTENIMAQILVGAMMGSAVSGAAPENRITFLFTEPEPNKVRIALTDSVIVANPGTGYASYNQNSSFHESWYEYMREIKAYYNGYWSYGLLIDKKKSDDALKIVDLVQDSPAAKAGLMKNDLIIKIDGKPLKDLKYKDARELIKNEPNSKIEMQILRGKEIVIIEMSNMFTPPKYQKKAA